MTNGFGAMPDYRAQIAPRDRWAIAAYVRALQLSQHAPAADVPGGRPGRSLRRRPAARRRGRTAAGTEQAMRRQTEMETHAVTTDVPALARLQQRGADGGRRSACVAGATGAFLQPDQFFRPG